MAVLELKMSVLYAEPEESAEHYKDGNMEVHLREIQGSKKLSWLVSLCNGAQKFHVEVCSLMNLLTNFRSKIACQSPFILGTVKKIGVHAVALLFQWYWFYG